MSVYVYIDRTLPKIRAQLLNYLDLQLFLNLCAWPFLTAWGLPFSPAGIIGNLIFPPFLSLFLTISSMIFFCELMGMPYGILTHILETISEFWYCILTLASRSWLFIGAHPPFYITLLAQASACTILSFSSFSQIHRIGFMSLVIFVCAFIIPRYQHTRRIQVPYGHKELSLIQSQGETLLIDPGILGRHVSAQQKIRYSLIPSLITQGIRRVDIVVVPKPSQMVFKALATLIEYFPVGAIYLPQWNAAGLPNAGWSAWELVLRKARDYGTTLHFIDTLTTFSFSSSHVTLSLSPKRIRRNKLIYHELMLESQT